MDENSRVIAPSALQLERYYFEHLSFDALDDFNLDAKEAWDVFNSPLPPSALEISAQFAIARTDARRRLVRLTIVLPPDATRFPCAFEARIVGAFIMQEGLSDEQCAQYCEANATALLFGAAREAIAALTGRGGLAPLILPSIYFVTSASEPEPLASTTKTKTAKTPRATKPKPQHALDKTK